MSLGQFISELHETNKLSGTLIYPSVLIVSQT
jgi:hypothetical protein